MEIYVYAVHKYNLFLFRFDSSQVNINIHALNQSPHLIQF